MPDVDAAAVHLPAIAPYPPSPKLISSIPPEEWQACLNAWIYSVEYRLRLPAEQFSSLSLSSPESGLTFLQSYFRSHALSVRANIKAISSDNSKSKLLHKRCFILLRRLLLEAKPPSTITFRDLLSLLAWASESSGTTKSWLETLAQLWKSGKSEMQKGFEAFKRSIILGNASKEGFSSLQEINEILKCSDEVGSFFMIGSDYLETMDGLYRSANRDVKIDVTAHLFLCFRSLLRAQQSTLLLDHLFLLKDANKRFGKSQATLLSDLVCTTRFLHIFKLPGPRAEGMLKSLQEYREMTRHLHSLPDTTRMSSAAKKKGKARAAAGDQEMHIHQAAQVSQIHDLFPDLSTAYILKLLDHFSNNEEDAIAGLLEPSALPQYLQDRQASINESAELAEMPVSSATNQQVQTPKRANVFNNDAFDNLQISSSKIRRGKQAIEASASSHPDAHLKSKAAIMAALAAFEADDDERDDTYDVGDVGGTVDGTQGEEIRTKHLQLKNETSIDSHEEMLFRAWKSDSSLFARDSKTRLSQPRTQIKRDTGMTDEQIEGWAIMLSRDKDQLNRLEKRYGGAAAFRGNQTVLSSSKWLEEGEDSAAGTGTEGEDGSGIDSDIDKTRVLEPSRDRGDGAFRRRGQTHEGRLRQGRGGSSTAGPSNDEATQNARRRKEQGRGRGGAHHHRREGRAKKMARGFGGGPAPS